MGNELKKIFFPRSVALLGATAKEEKWAYRAANNILKSSYEGKVYFINPKGGKILNKKVYPSILDIQGEVDVVLTALPVNVLKSAVHDCAKKGVKGIILVTAGLGEIDKVGLDLQNELVRIAHEGGSRIIGPNCMGVICNPCNLNLTSAYKADPGSIAFISQSGNLGIEVLHKASKRGLGFSYFVSVGNQADIQFDEYLEFFKDDQYTKAILIYMEGVANIRKFLQKAQQTAQIKPVIIYKVGKTQAGSRSAMSHTGSIAGKKYLYDAAFKQSGLISIANFDEFVQVAETLNYCPPLRGNNLALIGGGGGHATTMAEATEQIGLNVPILSEDIQNKAKEILLWRSPVKNPIDFAGGGDGKFHVYDQLTDICFRDSNIDGAIIYGIFGGYLNYLESPGNSYEDVAYELAQLVEKHKKPVIVQTMYETDNYKSIETLRSLKIPVNESAEITAKCLSALKEYNDNSQKLKNRSSNFWPIPTESMEKTIIDSALKDNRSVMIEPEIREILDKYNIPSPSFKMVKNKQEAVIASEGIGYPVVLKIISPDIVHKSDIGGVKTGLRNKREVEKTFDQIALSAIEYKKDARIYGMGVFQSMPKGVEIIIGATRDDEFGPVVMFGIGGIFVEVLKDVSFRILPIVKADAYEMIEEIKCFPILKGVRGKQSVDIELIVDTLVKVSDMVLNNPKIQELDINPLIAYEKGISAVDARILLR